MMTKKQALRLVADQRLTILSRGERDARSGDPTSFRAVGDVYGSTAISAVKNRKGRDGWDVIPFA